MTEPDLRDLLNDAVSDVEPADRLGQIRARVARPARRPWRYAVGGAVLATAATVTAVAVVTGDPPAPSPPPGPADPPSGHAAAVYFLGDTPSGPRLFREFQSVRGTPAPVLVAVTLAPNDPDYETLWTPRAFTSVTLVDDELRVEVLDGGLRDAPAGVSSEQAELSVQQVVYTVQALVGQRLPVRFLLHGEPLDRLYGVPVDAPVTAAPQADVLAQVSISDPVEDLVVSGHFTARGAANSPEATVPWELLDGEAVVASGVATATGSIDRLYPWETRVDVADLAPGSYTFVARTVDDSDGEGPGPDVDTRTVVVE